MNESVNAGMMNSMTKKPLPSEVWFPVEELAAYYNPFELEVWPEINGHLRREEILTATPFHPDKGECLTREQHAGRIKWFVENGWDDPIVVDVGIPSLGYFCDWPVLDGNHRLGAAVYRGDEYILAGWQGSEDGLILFGVNVNSYEE